MVATMKEAQGACNEGYWSFLHCFTTPSPPKMTFGAWSMYRCGWPNTLYKIISDSKLEEGKTMNVS